MLIKEEDQANSSPYLADIFRHLAGRRLRSRDSSGHCPLTHTTLPRHTHTHTHLVTQPLETGAAVFCNIRNYTSLNRYMPVEMDTYLIREVWHVESCEVYIPSPINDGMIGILWRVRIESVVVGLPDAFEIGMVCWVCLSFKNRSLDCVWIGCSIQLPTKKYNRFWSINEWMNFVWFRLKPLDDL